jgi:peptidoglycan hydrolase CwlO-like protein
MSNETAELQRQVNELQLRVQLLSEQLKQRDTVISVLESNVKNLQHELAECRKRLK